ncbi:MAG: PDZ domain-containing protein, partial [Gammaproteobacteria bacterium]|nr:PDZ domain-containing protein [Gammaproteobacteria bacterium]
MKHRYRKTVSLLTGAVIIVGFCLSSGVVASKPDKEAVPMQELRAFAQIFGRIKEDYVEAVDDVDLLESAIDGMLSGLDPHSTYLNPEEFKDLQEGTSGEFGGLGIEVGIEDGFIKVIAPIDDTPAQRAGVKSGDLIIRLDGKPVKGMGLEEAVGLMRGKPGTLIILTIVREAEDKPLKISIKRAIIKSVSVKSKILEEGYGYIRLSH